MKRIADDKRRGAKCDRGEHHWNRKGETHTISSLAASVLLGEVALAQRSAENPSVGELGAFSFIAGAPEPRLDLIPS